MTTDNLIEIIKRVWVKAMPKEISTPDDYNLFLWSKKHLDDVTYAIQRSAEKMAKKLSEDQPVSADSAQRYTTGILTSRTEWRKARHVRTGIKAEKTEVDGNKEGL
jgi:hypothetical protein